MSDQEQEINSGLGELRDRVGKLEQGFTKLSKDLAENTAVTKRVEENTAGLVGALSNLDGFSKVMDTVAKFTKPFLMIGGGIATIWVAMKTGTGIGPK